MRKVGTVRILWLMMRMVLDFHDNGEDNEDENDDEDDADDGEDKEDLVADGEDGAWQGGEIFYFHTS